MHEACRHIWFFQRMRRVQILWIIKIPLTAVISSQKVPEITCFSAISIPADKAWPSASLIRELTRKFGPRPEINISDRHHSSPPRRFRFGEQAVNGFIDGDCAAILHHIGACAIVFSAMKPDGRAYPQRLRVFEYSQTRGAGS